MTDEPEHTMIYRAATAGLSKLGIPDSDQAGWACSCGRWSFRARSVPDQETGTNLAEANHSHTVHVTTAHRWTGADITDTRP